MERTLAAMLVAVVSAQIDVSRTGADLAQVIVVTAPGVTYPTQAFGLAVDPAEEPTRLGHLTPLGQRQHFLIGSELRRRYVEEAGLLDNTYSINQSYLQTPFAGENISSL